MDFSVSEMLKALRENAESAKYATTLLNGAKYKP